MKISLESGRVVQWRPQPWLEYRVVNGHDLGDAPGDTPGGRTRVRLDGEYCAQALATAREIRRILRPHGCVVLTIDLFLDVAPFTEATRNTWGTNINVAAFLGQAGLELEEGNPAELCGFPQFDPDVVLRRRTSYLQGSYPALVQCVVARPRGQGPVGELG